MRCGLIVMLLYFFVVCFCVLCVVFYVLVCVCVFVFVFIVLCVFFILFFLCVFVCFRVYMWWMRDVFGSYAKCVWYVSCVYVGCM